MCKQHHRTALNPCLNDTKTVTLTVYTIITDAETERLLNEIEDNLRMLVPSVNTLDTEFGIEISLAMQPLRSENANLRRYNANYMEVYFAWWFIYIAGHVSRLGFGLLYYAEMSHWFRFGL